MSFGFDKYNSTLRKAVGTAHAQGIVMFAAASNSGAVEGRKESFPSKLRGQVIRVNSTDGLGSKSRFNPPPASDSDNFSLLGESVRSAWPRHLIPEGYRRQSGTSIATPIAAGIAALVLDYAGQRANGIDHETVLWHFDGMRTILNKMVQVNDGYAWIRPWEILSVEKENDDISNQLIYELRSNGM